MSVPPNEIAATRPTKEEEDVIRFTKAGRTTVTLTNVTATVNRTWSTKAYVALRWLADDSDGSVPVGLPATYPLPSSRGREGGRRSASASPTSAPRADRPNSAAYDVVPSNQPPTSGANAWIPRNVFPSPT